MPRLFFILNPGRQSRHYIQGLIAAAHRLQIPYITFELDQVWKHLESASDKPAAIRGVQTQVARVITSKQITHAFGYIHNGVFDFGLVKDGDNPPRSLLTSLGVRHFLLWTDHPEWALDGTCLQPPVIDHLRDDRLFHILKSDSAAAEAASILRWPNIQAMPMAEDYASLPPIPPPERRAIHDVVLIRGDAAPIPPILHPFLNHPDPDPAELDTLMRPAALDRFASLFPDHLSFANSLLDAKTAHPTRSFFSLLSALHSPPPTLATLPTSYYSALSALRIMVHWRRNFWPAWLARRVNVGSYGSPAHDPFFNQTPEAAAWVPYDQQPATYARGRIALNINAAHDEEGLTHKPFQIAASQIPCIHHETQGLRDCFTPEEVLTFRRGPELLESVHSLLTNPPARTALADSMHARALRDHTWDQRLKQMLAHEE